MNFVATWAEGGVEGEGKTRDEAVDDCRAEIVKRYKHLRDRLAKGARLMGRDEQQWQSMLHFIGEARRGAIYKPAPGEEYQTSTAGSSPEDEDYKGPIFG